MNKIIGKKIIVTWISVFCIFTILTIILLNQSPKIYSRIYYKKNLQEMKWKINNSSSFYTKLAENLASNKNIIDALDQKSDSNLAENELDIINFALDSSIVYLMDKNGDVIASSGNRSKNLIGNNYSFRDYFLKAISGQNGLMMAIGFTTGVRGIYYSSPVYKNGSICGVIVIKKNLDRIDSILSDTQCYYDILTDNNTIFSSKRKEWLLKQSSETITKESMNTISTDIFMEDWKLRIIYKQNDLVQNPVFSSFVILFLSVLLFVTFTVTLFLISISKSKRQIEENLLESKKKINTVIPGLKRTIKERTSELESTQIKLIEAEKMAALGNLVVGISHEVNTPIGVAVMASTFLKEKIKEILDKKIKVNISNLNILLDSTEIVVKNLLKASEIINTFKQITGDAVKEDPGILNMKEHINETINSIKMNNDLKFPINVNCPDKIEFSTYPLAFYYIFNNLIENTQKHGFTGKEFEKIDIKISLENKKLLIVYTENGSGMDCKTCNRICDPFFTTKRGSENMGLGMYIVYNIVVKLYGGDISCQSEPGEGIIIKMSLYPVE